MNLETERLVLRPWATGDLDYYQKLSIDVGYNCFTIPGQFFVQTTEEAIQRVKQRVEIHQKTRLGKFLIFLKDSGEFIGNCGIDPYELDGKQEYELGYRLMLNAWGKGYATEAARAMLNYGLKTVGLKRIIAFALPQNQGSLQVMAKIGFRYVRDFVHANNPHRLYEVCSS